MCASSAFVRFGQDLYDDLLDLFRSADGAAARSVCTGRREEDCEIARLQRDRLRLAFVEDVVVRNVERQLLRSGVQLGEANRFGACDRCLNVDELAMRLKFAFGRRPGGSAARAVRFRKANAFAKSGLSVRYWSLSAIFPTM